MGYIKYGHYIIYKTSEYGFKQEAYNTLTGTLYKYDFTKIKKFHIDYKAHMASDKTSADSAYLLLTLLILGEITVHERSLLDFCAILNGKDITDRTLTYLGNNLVIEPRSSINFPLKYKNPEIPYLNNDPDEETPYFNDDAVQLDELLYTSLDEFYTAVGYYSVIHGNNSLLERRFNEWTYIYAIDSVVGNFNREFIPESGRNPRNIYGTRAHKITYNDTFLASGTVLGYHDYGINIGIKTEPFHYVRALEEIVEGPCRLLPFNLDNITFIYGTKGTSLHHVTVTDGKTSVKYSCKVTSLTKPQLHAVAWAELNLYCGYVLDLEDFSEECELRDDNVKALLNYAKTLEEPNFTPYYSKLSIRKEIINEI